MRFRPALALTALLALLVAAAPADARRPPKAKRLTAFTSCAGLVDYAGRHVPLPPPSPAMPPQVGGGEEIPIVTPAPLAPAPESGNGAAGREDTSGTNNQEAGVDEPDTVKTDGTTLFVLSGAALHAVDTSGDGPPRLIGTIDFKESYANSMLLSGDTLLVLGGGPSGARMIQVDVSDPRAMLVRRTQDVDGWIVDARLVGRSARVVVSSYPEAASGSPGLRAQPRGWLPESTLTYRRSGRQVVRKAVACDSVRRPAAFAGAGVLAVYTVDLRAGLPAVDADAVLSGGETVYASASSLYVATQRWDDGTYEPGTMLHRFDITDPDRTTYAASGFVPGTLLNQFSLSEDKGILRAASTRGWGSEASSRVTTLEQQGGYLVVRGRVEGLGEGERIYAVRFLGDVGYVVTFRQTDPLYAIDLSDPDHPAVRGELKIPGYSAYLHPVGDGLLLGVGQDADEATGRTRGLQISLFDVSDLAHPARLQQRQLGDRFSGSAVEFDHHAFLWWPATKLALLPVGSEDFTGAAGFTVDRAGGIAELGRITHPAFAGGWTPSIERAAVIRGRLFTVSALGVRASGLADLADGGWAAFPDPPYGGPVPMPVEPGIPIAIP